VKLLNNVGFMRLAAGHIVEAAELFAKAAARGALAGDPNEALVLRCNLAAAAAGLGRYPEAIAWCDEAIADDRPTVGQPGALAVFLPQAGWSNSPFVVTWPRGRSVAVATKASAIAALDDPSAVDLATALTSSDDSSWCKVVARAISERVGRSGLEAEA
jgi:hypothetical protein